MRETHRYIADAAYNGDLAKKVLKRILKRKRAATGKKIAIVGAGPAGLSGAFYLALLGHKVTIYDSAPDAGGMLRYALPEYRLPKHVVDKEVAFIRGAGVQFKFNAALEQNAQARRAGKETRRGAAGHRHLGGNPARHPRRGFQGPIFVARISQRLGPRQETAPGQKGRRHRRRQFCD